MSSCSVNVSETRNELLKISCWIPSTKPCSLLETTTSRLLIFQKASWLSFSFLSVYRCRSWLTQMRNPRPICWSFEMSLPWFESLQMVNTLGLSQPSCNAQIEKINRVGLSKESNFFLSLRISSTPAFIFSSVLPLSPEKYPLWTSRLLLLSNICKPF